MAEIPNEIQARINQAAEMLRGRSSVLFITGAGLSADSGLPTYRGIGGLYNRGGTPEGFPIEIALSGEMLRRRPEVPWKHIAEIERACRAARYNRGHEVIAEMERRFTRLWVLTQNVDGFHRAAGSRHVIDIHGDFHYLSCMDCAYHGRVQDYSHFSAWPPRCPDCGGVLRPDVVLFNELLPRHKLERLQQELARGFEIVFSVGTSNYFPYIAEPVLRAAQKGVPTVEINPAATGISDAVQVKIAWPAAAALDAVWQVYQAL